jgi:competence ComEA-like helix-hairpin-helix protein
VETHRIVEPEAWFPEEAQRININTASVEQLKELPGIGDALAKRIVEYREEHGFFDSIARLLEVKGIGAKTFQGIQDLITVIPFDDLGLKLFGLFILGGVVTGLSASMLAIKRYIKV